MRADHFNLFATPVLAFGLEDTSDLNRELRERFIAESESSPGVARSNTGGWHSEPDLSLRQEPCYQHLMRRVAGQIETVLAETAHSRGLSLDHSYRFGIQSWAMVMREGDYAVVHDHAQAHWSVVYYVDAGDADLSAHPNSGRLTFLDPRGALTAMPGLDLFPGQFSMAPKDGMLVVFPGFLQHFVHPYRGSRPRISVSCNVRVEIVPSG